MINLVAAQIFSGITYGSIYGLLALSIVFLFRANRLFNLATTEIATFFAICMFLMLKHVNYFLAFVVVILMSFLGGLFLHLGLMRIITERKKNLHANEAVVTIGMYTILNSLSSMLNEEPEKFPTPLPNDLHSIFGVNVPTHDFVILGVAAMIMVTLYVFLHHTKMGSIIEATSENPSGARLKGIKTSNVMAIAWGISTVISTVAGILIAPVLFLSPSMLTQVFGYSLIAVVIGGLESLPGTMIGGILVGVTESLASNIPYVGSDLKFGAVFLLLLIVLVLKPRGLWGRAEHRRV